jgi:hypothetical protein
MLRENPEAAKAAVDTVIRNTYRTLMSRGMRGCFIHATDPETNAYFRSRIEGNWGESPQSSIYEGPTSDQLRLKVADRPPERDD